MKVSAEWLRRFVTTDKSLEDIAEALTTAGLEVDEIEDWPVPFKGVVVASVMRVEAHPERSDVMICTLVTGDGGVSYQVVCADPNVSAGMRAPFAAVGATLADGRMIERTVIGGVESTGMLCSAAELGVGMAAGGVWVLPDDAPVGRDFGDYLRLPDESLVLDLTPNRGDCLGMLGVAREVALAVGSAPPAIEQQPIAPDHDERRGVTLSAPQACSVYCTRVVTDINSQCATPPWISERLRRGEIGSISGPVDITNYVMLALGQPMHAFDADKLVGGIDVRMAHAGEPFVTLDQQQLTLAAETLVIADAQGPVAIAGVIGGQRTAVTESTRNIVFESACFKPAAVAGQGRRYKIQTDSLHRFERGVDPAMAETAIEYATALCQQIAGGRTGPVNRVDGESIDAARSPIKLDSGVIERVLGQSIEPEFVVDTLKALGLEVHQTAPDAWSVLAPSWRYDLEIAADLIEEIARVYGYERIATQNARVALTEPVNKLTDPKPALTLLVGRGYSEIITYSFVDSEFQSRLLGNDSALALDNPIANNMDVMRRTLWIGLIEAYQYNRRRDQHTVRLYENGLCFEPEPTAEHGIAQTEKVAALIAGDATPASWDVKARSVDFFDAKGDLEALLAAAGQQQVRFEAKEHPGLKSGRSARIWCADEPVGWIGQLSNKTLKSSKDNNLPYVFEVNSSSLHPARGVRYQQISDQPRITRDLALLVAEDLPAGRLVDCVWSNNPEGLQTVDVVDVYKGGDLESGFKSVALRLIFQAKTSTLTNNQVDNVIYDITSALATTCGAYLRGT